MQSFMARYSSQGYALMRIVAGFLFLWHGVQKLFNFPSGMPEGVPAYIIYVAGPIELLCGILIMIGLLTRAAAFLASGLPGQRPDGRRVLDSPRNTCAPADPEQW
jgi:putative oxidoreductase